MNHFRKKLIVELSITVAIIAALSGGIAFFGSNITKYSAETILLREQLAQRAAALQSLSVLKADYNSKAKNYLSVLYNIVPQKDQLINLSKELQSLTSQSKLNYGFSFIEEAAPTDRNLGWIKFRLNLSGGFEELLESVKALQGFHYLTALDNLSLNRQGANSQMVVNGRVFFR